ncbi:MAG: hypothetical protein V8Q43_03840 [Christensenellaceae bacterium]
MKLREMLKENGALESFDKMGFGAENVIGKLNAETDERYAKYQWFNGGFIVHAVPPMEMLEAGYPWEEWYRDRNGVFQHHVLYLKKTDKCDMTFDGTNLPPEDGHPEPTKGHFWYLYNDEDASLLYTR